MDEALEAISANRSRRYCKLDTLERWVETKQYEGRQDWFFAGEKAKPLLERAPCIAYPIVDSAITSNIDLLLGEGRRPTFKVSLPVEAGGTTTAPKPKAKSDGEDDSEPKEHDPIEDGIADIIKQSRFWKAAREVFRQAQSCGTAVSVYGARKGRLFIDTVLAKWCTPEFDDEGAVTRLEIRYPYLELTKDARGGEIATAKIYRRVIDAEKDTTYKPAKAEKQGVEPNWTPDRVIAHGLGHCPVIWYAHMAGVMAVNEIDGRAIHAKLLDEVFALDCSLSQRHRAGLTAGDPQWTEVGVEEGGGPKATGRHPNPDHLLETAKGGLPSKDNPVTGGHYTNAPPSPARKKGPGEVWQYENPDVKVQLHTLPGDALKAISDHASDLRLKIHESLCVVFLDADSIKFAASLSGKAMLALKARQLDRCDQYREDFGDDWIVPQMLGLLRVVAVMPEQLRLRTAKALAAMMQAAGGDPDLDLKWGQYFKPTIEDMKLLVELLKEARDAGFATLRMAIEKLEPIFGIADIEKAVRELEGEAKEKERKAQDREDKLFEIADGARGGTPAGLAPGGRGRGANPPPTPPTQQPSPQ